MGLTQATFRRLLRKHLGIPDDETQLDNDSADSLLNRSFWEIAPKFKFTVQDARATLATTADQAYVDLPAAGLESIQAVVIIDPDTTEHELIKRTTFHHAHDSVSYDTDNTGHPEHYHREGNKLYLYPIPDAVYSLLISYKSTLADVATSGFTTPQSWDEIILYGAVWRGFLELGDHLQASTFQKTQAALVASTVPVEAKDEADSRYAGIVPYGYDGY